MQLFPKAAPFIRCARSWECSEIRAYYEAIGIKTFRKISPKYLPELYYYNKTMGLFAMEYLKDFAVLRDCEKFNFSYEISCHIYLNFPGLISRQKVDNLGKHLGDYLSQQLFTTAGELQKDPHVYSEFEANSLVELTKKVIFTDVFGENLFTTESNRWTPGLQPLVESFSKDEELIKENQRILDLFLHSKEVLAHGDLHTGSIMVLGEHLKILDVEFVFVGPMAFDIGMLLANFIINICANRKYNEFVDWEFEQLTLLWESILANAHLSPFPLDTLFSDVASFTGVEIIRRILGIAHVEDFETIQDVEEKVISESVALRIARDLMVNHARFAFIHDVISFTQSILKEK